MITRTAATGQQRVERLVVVLRMILALALLGCVGFLVAATLRWPLVGDATLMHYGAFLLSHGFAPYRQIIDINFPGCFLLDWTVIHTFGPGALGWRLFDFALMGAAAAAMFAIARPGERFGALFAACFLFVLHVHDGVDQAGERDLVLAVLLLLACAAIFHALRRRSWGWSLGFGLICGAASLIKPTALPWAVGVLILAAIALHRRRQRILPYCVAASLGFLAPIALDLLFLVRRHAVHACFLILTRLVPYHAQIDRFSLRFLLTHLLPSALFPVVLVWLPLAVLSRRWRTWEGAALYCSVAIGIVSFCAQGKAFPYHRYPLEAFLFLLIGLDAAEALRTGGWRRVPAAALLIFAVFVLAPSWSARASHYDWQHDAFTQSLTTDLSSLGGPSLSGHIQCLDMHAGCLGALYQLRLVQSTGFLYDCYFLNQPQSAFTLEMRRRFLDDLERDPPNLIVVSNQDCLGRPLRYFSPQAWSAFSTWLGANYSIVIQRQPKRLVRWWPVARQTPRYRIYRRKSATVGQSACDCFSRPHIGEDKAVALDDLAAFDRDGLAEHRPGVDGGVELSVFAAGIDAWREIAQEGRVEVAARKFARQLPGIDANDAGAQATGNHLFGKGASGTRRTPDGKDRLETGALQFVNAILADVFEEEIAEGNGFDAVRHSPRAGGAHGGFIVFVRARPGKRDGDQRQPRRGGLGFEQRAARAVHGHAVEGGVEGGKQADDLVLALLAEAVQRPAAVFAAAPGKEELLHASQRIAEGRALRPNAEVRAKPAMLCLFKVGSVRLSSAESRVEDCGSEIHLRWFRSSCEVSTGCPSDQELGSWVCEDSVSQESRWTTTRMPD